MFLLDWSIGPQVAVVSPATLGLYGGLTAGIADSVVMALMNRFLGGAATWIPILLFFPIATVGVGRLAGRSRWSRLAAGALYAVNPFVFNRVFVGHVPLLIGYALLPFATVAALASIASPARRWIVPALWWAVLTALSPHFAWIFGVVVVGVVIVAAFSREHRMRRIAGWFATVVVAFALMSAYIYLPYTVTNLPTRVGSASLSLYSTTPDPHLGLFANVIGLYGFWRTGPGPELPKEIIAGWPFFMLTILLVVGFGASGGLRRNVPRDGRTTNENVPKGLLRDPSDVGGHSERVNRSVLDSLQSRRRLLAFLLLFIGVTGYFLALGSQGPTGGLFSWAYNHVPFFAVMREPEKFLMLLALTYAVSFGWGIERLSKIDFSSSKAVHFAVAAMLGIALPLSYTPNIFNGLAGQIAPSTLPSSYQRANTLMGNGPGNILYLPWHLYMAYPFTNNRVVANVGTTSFSRDVIAGDNVESGGVTTQSTSPRSAYLQELFKNARNIEDFGALVAPLGVRYVVLAKTVNWQTYSWLNGQKDLQLVLNSASLEIWRNCAYYGVGARESQLRKVSNFAQLLRLARANELGAAVVKSSGKVRAVSPHVSSPTTGSLAGTSSRRSAVQELSPVAYQIAPGKPGWVTVDTPFQRGWSLEGRSAISTAEGTVLVRVGRSGGILKFTPWGMVRLGYFISTGVFLALLISVLVESRRRKLRTLGTSLQRSVRKFRIGTGAGK
ncbi:MAG: hypothetical protein HIU84_07525 [Acidobacteria bacterium]|nr:hypothetical protein [Acidobacteriota bacterium]